MKNRIHFLEGVTLSDMAAIYQSAEIMIYPLFLKGLEFLLLKRFFPKYLLLLQVVVVLMKVVVLHLTI